METNRALHFAKIYGPVFLGLAAALFPQALVAQQSGGGAPSDEEKNPPGVSVDAARKTSDLATYVTTQGNEGVNGAGYEIKQSVEFGGRIVSFSGSNSPFTGNRGMWDTFVNLDSGARLLEYSLDMHSPDHAGLLFDDLHFNNFGYGGDPDNVSRLNISKMKIYNFDASFRRDKNYFDYDLLANPLNPATSNPNIPVVDSPHAFFLTRRMSDVNLRLFPVGKIGFRVGWSRVVNEGTTFSSTHQGTEGLVQQPSLNTSDNYHGGVSFRFIPRTSINYDQYYTYFKGDTSGFLGPFPFFSLANGTPVNLGIPFNTAANQPCAIPILGTGFANPSCNGYISYSRFGNTRNSFPTEQFSFQSNYFNALDLSGRFSYTDAEGDSPNSGELFNGLITRTRGRSFQTTGSSKSHRVSATADFALTYHITNRFRVSDVFRFDNFRIPGSWNQTTNNLFGATLLSTPNQFSLATCPPPFTAATCPQHSTSSGADIVNDTITDFLRQDEKLNTIELEYDFDPRLSGHIGYRYEHRDITDNFLDTQFQTYFPKLPNRGNCAGLPVVAGVCTVSVPLGANNSVEINGHSLILGFSARPIKNLRFSFDTEMFKADNAFTRISPLRMQQYRLRGSYKPYAWVQFGSAVTIFENKNDAADIGNHQHNRSYAFSATFAPAEAKWGVDVSYDYNDIFSETNICFVATPSTPGALSCGKPFLSGVSTYSDTAHNGTGSIYYKPVSRVTAAIGYTITSTTGNTLILNPIAPTGPLSYTYHLPSGSLAIDLVKHVTFKTGWNFYDYNEKSDPGPTLPRNFRGNVFTLSLRYAM
jgi:hypothetical protein